jgi:ribonucleoside-diphosphate reductase alpha chain
MNEISPNLLRELEARGLSQSALFHDIMKRGSIGEIDGLPQEIRDLYKTALEISPAWHVRMQAAFQKHSDNAVSKTVNLPNDSKPEDVESVYRLAHVLGCKGITVFRDRCRDSQVLNSGCAACA